MESSTSSILEGFGLVEPVQGSEDASQGEQMPSTRDSQLALAEMFARELDGVSLEKLDRMNTSVRYWMAASVINYVGMVGQVSEKVKPILGRLADYAITQVTSALELNTLDLDSALSYLERLINMSTSVAELQRRTLNGRDMFSASSASPKERALMDLLKRVDSESKRDELEAFLKDMDARANGEDSEGASKVEPDGGVSANVGNDIDDDFED